MDLSGLYIEGTGTYEVKEIAPPTLLGQLVIDPGLNDPTKWTLQTGWSIVGGVALANTAGATGLLTNPVIAGMANKWFKCTMEVVSFTSGAGFRFNFGGTTGLTRNAIGVYTEYIKAPGTVGYSGITTAGATVGSVDNIYIEEVPEGYPLLDKGDTYFACTSSGQFPIQNDQAFGEWEYSVYKGSDTSVPVFAFINQKKTIAGGRYTFTITNTEAISLYRDSNIILTSAASYIKINTWYRIKITRTLDGEFYLYIKGGGFGWNDWTLVDVSGGSGSNPVIDITYTTCKYSVYDLDAGDCIGKFITRKAVRQ